MKETKKAKTVEELIAILQNLDPKAREDVVGYYTIAAGETQIVLTD